MHADQKERDAGREALEQQLGKAKDDAAKWEAELASYKVYILPWFGVNQGCPLYLS